MPRVDNLERTNHDLQLKISSIDPRVAANGAVAESLRQYLQQQNGPLPSPLDRPLQIRRSRPPSRVPSRPVSPMMPSPLGLNLHVPSMDPITEVPAQAHGTDLQGPEATSSAHVALQGQSTTTVDAGTVADDIVPDSQP